MYYKYDHSCVVVIDGPAQIAAATEAAAATAATTATVHQKDANRSRRKFEYIFMQKWSDIAASLEIIL